MFNQLRQIVDRNELSTNTEELEKLYIKTLSDIKGNLQDKAMEMIINGEYRKLNDCTKDLEEIDGIWKEYSEEFTEQPSTEEIFMEKTLLETNTEADDIKNIESIESIVYKEDSSETEEDSNTEEDSLEQEKTDELPKTFEIELKDENGNIRATAKYLSNGKILLLSGSKISLKIESYMNKVLIDIKQDLVKNGKLADVGEYYRLLEDETFQDIKDTNVMIFGDLKNHTDCKWLVRHNRRELDDYLKELRDSY